MLDEVESFSSVRRSRSPGPKLNAQMVQGYLPDHLPGMQMRGIKGYGDIDDGIKFNAPLMMEQAEELILLATSGKPLPAGLQVRDAPPLRPIGDTMYLIKTRNPSHRDHSGLCSDGYNWIEILHQADLATTRGNSIDYRHYYIGLGHPGSREKTSSRFRREAYTLIDLTLVAYIGDEREAMTSVYPDASTPSNMHQKHHNSLPRSHRYGKKQDQGSRMKRTNVFGPQLDSRKPVGGRPRSLDRVEMERQLNQHSNELQRLQMENGGRVEAASSESSSVTALRNMPLSRPSELFDKLTSLSEELAGGKLVKNLTLFPSMQITLVHPDMTREFEQSCQVLYGDHPDPTYLGLEEGILLFYDITFPLGRVYATLLTYINCCYEGNPVMPLAVNLHERKFKSSHQLFWARIVGDIPALQKYRFPLMIDDAEPAVHLAVRTQAPNLVQLEGWTHRFRDIDRHLRSKGYGEEAVSYYKACIGYLLSANSKQSMHDRYRKEFECVWPKDFVHYYRNKLLPRSGRLGKWAMAKMNIKEPQYFSPHTNPQERFHMLCRNFSGWETMTVDQIVRAFHLLFVFFIVETKTSSSSSAFVLKSNFRPFFHQLKPMSSTATNYAANTLHPADIRQFILHHFPKDGVMISRYPMDPMVAYGSSTSQLAVARSDGGLRHHAGIEDVLQLCDASESMFQDQVEFDPDNFDLTDLLRGEESAKFLSNGHLPTSSIGYGRYRQVPSPAPNGRVPSPAPGDGEDSHGPSHCKYQHGGSGGTVGGNQVNPPLRSIHSSLSTIPEVPSENKPSAVMPSTSCSNPSAGTLGGLGQAKAGSGTSKITMKKGDMMPNNYPPDLLVHSSHPSTQPLPNWQESFESSIVTDSHYDASFESEIPFLGVQMEKGQEGVLPAASLPNSQRKHLFQRPPPNQVSKNKVASQNNVKTAGFHLQSERPSNVNGVKNQGQGQQQSMMPNSLMLWKKVQHYVVVGGAFVSAAQSGSHSQTMPTSTASQGVSIASLTPSSKLVAQAQPGRKAGLKPHPPRSNQMYLEGQENKGHQQQSMQR